MATSGSSENTGVVYDLISEGEIELVNGLASIYLNRTPIVNSSSSTRVEARKLYGTKVNSTTFTIIGRYETTNMPIVILGGQAQGTVNSWSSTATQTTIGTSAAFFTSSMVNSNITAPANFRPRIRIAAGNLDGSEYVGSVVSYSSTTSAVLEPALQTSPVGKTITFDYYSNSNTITTSSDNGYLVISQVVLGAAIPNYANLSNTFGVFIDGLYANLPGSSSDEKNFKNVLVAFRNGTEDQPPVEGIPSFTNASLGANINSELKQHTDYFTSTITGFWGKYRLEHPSGATGGSSVSVTASQVSPGSANEVDELAVTISCPQGLYAANQEGSPRNWGAVFQIWFKYRNGANSWKSELIYGPTDAEIAAATILVAADSGTFRRYGPDPPGTIKAASKSPIDFDFRWNIEQYKPFDDFSIEIKKVTTDNLEYNNDIMVCTTYVKSVQAFINDKLSYPFSAYCVIAFDSIEFGGDFPERAYDCYGVRSDTPTNYITREEASDGVAKYTRNSSTGVDTGTYQIWDGTFRRAYNNNPVWNLRELLLNKRWGLGNWLSESNVNDYSLYSMARYCDELVPDGNGGYEPRFACNVYLTQATEVYKVIKDFCTIMLALPYWVDGELLLEGDRPSEPVYTFTKANIENGVFSYESTSNKTRPNQIVVRYNNSDLFYEQDVELVDDVENMLSTGKIFSEEVIAFGATTRGQAVRYGKWKLLTSKMQKEIVNFRTGENAAYLRPGNVINIQDADRNSVRYSGRIASASGTTIVLDSNVTTNANTFYLHTFIEGPATYLRQATATIGTVDYVYGDQLPYTINSVTISSEQEASEIVDDSGDPVSVQFVPDAHLETREISSISGANVTLSSAFTSDPEADTVWAITEKQGDATVAGSAKQYKILGIGEDSPGVYTITAAEHYNSKFDLIDEEYLATPNNIVPRYTAIPSVTNFLASVTSSRITNDSEIIGYNYNIHLNWDSPKEWVGTVQALYPYFDYYELEIGAPDGNIETVRVSKTKTSYTVPNAMEGTYYFAIKARSTVGPASTPTRTEVSVITPSTTTAPVVANIPKGGSFSSPFIISSSDIVASSVYKFTANSGRAIFVDATAPTSPSVNDYWYDTVNTVLKYYDGSIWQTA